MSQNNQEGIKNEIFDANEKSDNSVVEVVAEISEVIEDPLKTSVQKINYIYNKVITSQLFDKLDSDGNRKTLFIYNQEDYKDIIDNHEYLYEIIGGTHQIKPVFDVEIYLPKSIFKSKKEISIFKQLDIKTNEIIGDILQKLNLLFPNKKVKICKRQPRIVLHLKEENYKLSLHFIVLDVRITSTNLLNYLITHKYTNDKPFDLSIYSNNHLLSLPYTTKPDKGIDRNIPVLLPIFNNDDNNIFNYCASYIEDIYEDYDLKFENVEEVILDKNKKYLNYDKINNGDEFDNENTETTEFIYNKLINNLIPLLEEERSNIYDTWIKCVWCLINICNKSKISRTKCYTLIHLFSKKSKNYEEEKVDKWIDKNFDNTNTEKGYGWGYLYNTCIKEDNSEYYEKNLKKSYKKVKEEWEKKASKLRDPVGFIVINDAQDEFNQKPYIIYSKSELLIAYEDMKCWVVEKDKWIKKDFVPLWLKDENISVYNDVIFRPYIINDLNKKHFNLFNGLRVNNLKICRNYEIILPILNHIKAVICKNREDIYIFIMQYFAQIIQHPEKKTNVVMLIKGKQGCGKNIIIDLIANGIIGTEYAASTANPERVLFGNFNSLLGNKILAVMNEAGNNLRECMDKMKDIATAPTINVEKKGKDPIVFENYINIIGTTNNFNSLDISIDDRRCLFIECNNNYIGNIEYFNNLANICTNEEAISSFYHYLLEEVKITITDFQKSRPITTEYKRIQKLNINNI